MTFRIKIAPVSDGSTHEDTLKPGDGSYAKTPAGPVQICVALTQAQIVGLQGYLSLLKAGSVTTTVETAITALTPA